MFVSSSVNSSLYSVVYRKACRLNFSHPLASVKGSGLAMCFLVGVVVEVVAMSLLGSSVIIGNKCDGGSGIHEADSTSCGSNGSPCEDDDAGDSASWKFSCSDSESDR